MGATRERPRVRALDSVCTVCMLRRGVRHCCAVAHQDRGWGPERGAGRPRSEAYRAIEHGRSGVQQGVDPPEEAQRIVDAFAALRELRRQAFPDAA